ncbi:MAG: hypothetical protein AAGB34_10945 [Planctomycetota bacterium]
MLRRICAQFATLSLAVASSFGVHADCPVSDYLDDNIVTLEMPSDVQRVFIPHFALLYTPQDPKLELWQASINHASYDIQNWIARTRDASGVRQDNTAILAGDGLNPDTFADDDDRRASNAGPMNGRGR